MNKKVRTILTIITILAIAVITTTIYKSHTADYTVRIDSIDLIHNKLTIQKDNDLYSFTVKDAKRFYLDENIQVSMTNDKKITNCKVIDNPTIYNTQIEYATQEKITVLGGMDKFTFDNEDGEQGWRTGESCKVVTQGHKLLAVNPIPLNER